MKIHAAILCGLLGGASVSLGQTESRTTESSSQKESPTRHMSNQAGVHIGLTKVEQLGDPVMTYGVYVDYPIEENLLFGAAVDYWNKSSGTIAETTVTANDLTAALNLKFLFKNLTRSFRPYLTAGAALHRFEIREAKNQTVKLESDYRDAVGKFGLDYGGGFYYQLQKELDVVGEIRYRSIMDSKVDLSQLAFTGGLNYVM